jgi:threonine dehydratase
MSAAGPVPVTEIYAARRRLQPYLRPTPLLQSAWLSSIADATVFLKIESLQLTSAFKIRGALNAALKLVEQAPASGGGSPFVVTASAGNHGRALALAGERLGMRVVVFTPATAPETKKAAIRRHGAELHDDPDDYDAAERAARAFAAAEGAMYVSPYNHPDVIAGAGTVALEILDAMPALDTVVVPVGGGGLISGIGRVMKAAAPDISVIGVEAASSTPFAASLARGEIAEIEVHESLADGLTGNLEPGSMTFAIVREVVDALVSVSEGDLARAIRGLAAEEHLIAEGAGAAATAALLAGEAVMPGRRAVVLVSGGNIDLDRLRRVIAVAD